MTDRLDRELRRALARREPPEGFADRVLAAAEARASVRERRFHWWRMPRLAVAVAACLLVLAAGLAVERHRRREVRARGEAARQQVMLALRITAAKLQVVQARVIRPAQGEDRI